MTESSLASPPPATRSNPDHVSTPSSIATPLTPASEIPEHVPFFPGIEVVRPQLPEVVVARNVDDKEVANDEVDNTVAQQLPWVNTPAEQVPLEKKSRRKRFWII